MGIKVIHKLRLAGWLMFKGHTLLRMENSQTTPGYNVFIFKDTERLHQDICDYTDMTQSKI